jgi:hypothetical protein
VSDQFEVGFIEQVVDVVFLAGEEVIEADHIVSLADEAFAQV